MNTKYLLSVFLLVFLSYGMSAQVTSVDASEGVADSLRAFGKVPVTSYKYVPMPGPPDGPVWRPCAHCPVGVPAQRVTVTTQEYLQASNIRIVHVDSLTWGADTVTSLPDQFIETSTVCNNSKGTQPLTCSGALTLTYTRTSSIAFSQSLSHTTSIGINTSVSIVPQVWSVGVSMQFGQTSTVGTTSTDGNSQSIAIQKNYSVTTQPKTASLTMMRVWTMQHKLPFTCRVTVDADLSSNNAGYKLLSDVFPDASHRTFLVKGYIIANNCSDAEISNTPATVDPASNTNSSRP